MKKVVVKKAQMEDWVAVLDNMKKLMDMGNINAARGELAILTGEMAVVAMLMKEDKGE